MFAYYLKIRAHMERFKKRKDLSPLGQTRHLIGVIQSHDFSLLEEEASLEFSDDQRRKSAYVEATRQSIQSLMASECINHMTDPKVLCDLLHYVLLGCHDAILKQSESLRLWTSFDVEFHAPHIIEIASPKNCKLNAPFLVYFLGSLEQNPRPEIGSGFWQVTMPRLLLKSVRLKDDVLFQACYHFYHRLNPSEEPFVEVLFRSFENCYDNRLPFRIRRDRESVFFDMAWKLKDLLGHLEKNEQRACLIDLLKMVLVNPKYYFKEIIDYRDASFEFDLPQQLIEFGVERGMLCGKPLNDLLFHVHHCFQATLRNNDWSQAGEIAEQFFELLKHADKRVKQRFFEHSFASLENFKNSPLLYTQASQHLFAIERFFVKHRAHIRQEISKKSSFLYRARQRLLSVAKREVLLIDRVFNAGRLSGFQPPWLESHMVVNLLKQYSLIALFRVFPQTEKQPPNLIRPYDKKPINLSRTGQYLGSLSVFRHLPLDILRVIIKHLSPLDKSDVHLIFEGALTGRMWAQKILQRRAKIQRRAERLGQAWFEHQLPTEGLQGLCESASYPLDLKHVFFGMYQQSLIERRQRPRRMQVIEEVSTQEPSISGKASRVGP